ncbi:MAG: hypothetical protein MUF06_12880 [Pirellulaceae bacterium]|nr:hypothetical protein [Pirellulaceae bacterium]
MSSPNRPNPKPVPVARVIKPGSAPAAAPPPLPQGRQPAPHIPKPAPVPTVEPTSAAPFPAISVPASKPKSAAYKRRANHGPVIIAVAATAAAIVALAGGGAYLATLPAGGDKPVAKKSAESETAERDTAERRSQTQNARPPAVARNGQSSTAADHAPAASDTSSSEFQFQPQYVDKAPGESTEGPVPAATAVAASLPSNPTPTTPPPSPPAPPTEPAVTTPSPPAVDPFVAGVVDLYESKLLLVKKEYPLVRKVFADQFARTHEAEIRAALGDEYDALAAWFDEHPAVREELYNAIDPAADKIPEVMRIFNELRKEFPDKIAPYGNLAIATSIVWDDPRRGVYDYRHHAERCKSTMPEGLLEAVDNFRYLVAAEPVMQGRIQYVPWEFLVHVVNHRTPAQERQWALQGFLPKRVMFGKCYSDVPYDNAMLESQSAVARMNNKPYTLPNLLTFGGVCAMQADFSSRVGKSLGVAAEYVRGEAAGGEGHAWVMWVELKQATPTGLIFTLESHGRYRGDKYYVGTLDDPQTGGEMTDRELELRLHTVGLDALAKRQAELVMKAYPIVRDQEQLDVPAQLAMLTDAINLSPGCEAAWLEVARLARESSGKKELTKLFQPLFERLFVTFARMPDFTWRVFDDLVAFQADPKQRDALFARLVLMYEVAGRPDLACEARLRLTDYLVEQDKTIEALRGLAFTVKKFPDEGRYVPKMLDRIDSICAEAALPDADKHLVTFYTEFLPMIPQLRGDRPSPYCIETYERAIALFQARGQPQLAQLLQIELANVKAGISRQKKA